MKSYRNAYAASNSRMLKNVKISGVALAALAVALFAKPAVAAESAPSAVAEQPASEQDIIVTANRREESIQKVPISISAVSAQQLADSKIQNVNDLGQAVPSIRIRNEFGIATPLTFIRGVGNASFVTTAVSPIGFYVDGISVGQNIAQGLQLFDVDRVEVLRGPQGTLFGRNTTGGLINFISRKPDLYKSTNGQASVTIGDYNTFNADAAIGGVLSPTAAYRFAILRQSDNGVFKDINPNVTDSRNVGAIDSTAARAQLLWAPGESFSSNFSAHWGRNDGGLVANKAGFFPSASGSNCPAGAVPGAVGNGCTDPFGFGIVDRTKFHETASGTPGYEKIRTFGGSVGLNYDLSDYTLTSVSAWDHAKLRRLHDSDGHEMSFLNSSFSADTSFWSQEFRIVSPTSGKFSWIAGLYYYGDKNNSFAHYGAGDPGAIGIAQRLRLRTQSYAAYADGTFEFNDRLKLTGGARWTIDSRQASIVTWGTNSYGILTEPAAPIAFVPAVTATGFVDDATATAAYLFPFIPFTELNKTWHKWSGRLSLSYSFDTRNLVYMTWAHGFKGGEFNGSAIISPQEVSLTNPEYVDNYEVGFKGSTLGGVLRGNISAFYMNYTDQQVQSYVSAGAVFPALANAGSSEIKGVEFEGQVRPNKNWLFSVNGTYLDAHFTKFLDPVVGDRAGNRLPSSSKWTLNGLVRYEHEVGPGSLVIQGNVQWTTKQYFEVDNQEGLSQGKYALADGRISYRFPDNATEIGFFAKNLFNEKYYVSGYDLRSFGSNTLQVGRPRVVGVDASYKF